MKQKRKNKTQKLVSKMCILSIGLIFLVIVMFLFSEKICKIEIVDNVKKHVGLVVEQIATRSNSLVLNTKVNLSAANGKGGVDLDWSTYDSNRKNI